MSRPAGVVLVPTPPLQVPALSRAQPDHLREEVEHLRTVTREAFDRLPAAEVAVVIVAGDAWRPGMSGPTTLDGFGVAGVDRPVTLDAAATEAVRSGGSDPAPDVAALGTSASVLTWLVAENLDIPQIAIEVDGAAAAETTVGNVRRFLDTALADRTWVAVCAGDLATTLTLSSAGYLVEDAADEENRFVAAVRDADLAAIAAWGPDTAARVRAPGWASVVVATDLAQGAGLDLDVTAHTRVKDIGGIVAVAS